MKNLKRSIIAGTFALCFMVGVSYATTASYNTTVPKINRDQTYASGTKTSGTNNQVFHHLQQSGGKMRFWVDGNTGRWAKVTGNYDFTSGQSGHIIYNSTPRAGSAMRLRGRYVASNAGGKTARGYVDFN